jgi:glycine cleavage system aminomethyltransferase T
VTYLGRNINHIITESYLTMFLNEQAGIIDDAIAINLEAEHLVRIVVNGSNKYKDMEYLKHIISNEKLNAYIVLDENLALIALQGP